MSTHLPPNIGCGVRRFLPVLLFTMFVAGAGCPSSDPGSADLDSEERAAWSGVDLTVAVPSGQGYRSRWPVLFEDWSARTGGSVSISAAAPSPREGGDIVVISITDVPAWDASGRLAEIQGTGLPVEELFDGLKKQVVSLGRVPRLVPIVLPTLVLYLRADLLESAGRTTNLAGLPGIAGFDRSMGRWTAGRGTLGTGLPGHDVPGTCRYLCTTSSQLLAVFRHQQWKSPDRFPSLCPRVDPVADCTGADAGGGEDFRPG